MIEKGICHIVNKKVVAHILGKEQVNTKIEKHKIKAARS